MWIWSGFGPISASAKLRWKPGGQTEMLGKYLVNSVGSYRVSFQAEKTF